MALLDLASERPTALDAAGLARRGSSGQLPYLPALDGLRGLAVAGVVAFHLGWIDGGYLGVDAFFVLSGFLITSLLLAEHRAEGRVDLRRFWGRRARRLLPAMLVTVAAVLVWAMVAAPEELSVIRGDALATLAYVANWHELATSSSYWAIFDAPSPLQHTWSLAIEEQFYVVWPLVVLLAAAVAHRYRRRLAGVLVLGSLVLAAASYVLMAALAGGGDVSRAYYGTGSRLGAIALGAALAAWLGGGRVARRPRAAASGRWLDAAAAAALLLLGWAWWRAEGTSPWLYRGGFLACAVAVVVVIAAVTAPSRSAGGVVGRMLSWAPLRGLGLISYGLYLWHWVVIATFTSARTGLDGLALQFAQLGLSLAAALLSYWCLEQPVRRRRWLPAPVTATTAAVGAYAAVLGLVGLSTTVSGPDLDALRTHLAPVTTPAPTPATTARAVPTSIVASTTTTLVPLAPARLGIFGDSTALRTGQGLEAYGRRTGSFAVTLNDGRVGCGVDQAGDRRYRGSVFVLAEFCGDLIARWAADLATQPIDVAVVQTGMWETVERRLPGQTSWSLLGDPAVDARTVEELRTANQFWADRGIPVVWLRMPTPTLDERPPALMPRFNQLLDQVVADFPTARAVALDGWLGALNETDRANLRPDGIHFTEATAAVVADAWLGDQVAAAADDLRRLRLIAP